MRNYIKSEFYRISHRRYYRLTVLIFCLLSVVGNLAFKTWGTKLILKSLDLLELTIATSPFILITFQNIILGDEIKDKTLNNVIANGISRDKIILSKIITTSVFSMLFSVIVIGVHIIVSIALFGGNEEGFKFISQFFMAYLSAIPFWIGLIALYTIFSVLIENQVVSVFIILAFMVIVPQVTRVISYFKPKLSFIHALQPDSVLKRLINLLQNRSLSNIDWFTVKYGLVLFVISTSIAISVFRKKDF